MKRRCEDKMLAPADLTMSHAKCGRKRKHKGKHRETYHGVGVRSGLTRVTVFVDYEVTIEWSSHAVEDVETS